MCPQIACLKGCKITLVAFVGLFSTMGFLMSPQRTWIRVTLVAFFWLFSTVFSNDSSNCLPERMQSHTVCICWTIPEHLEPFLNLSCGLSHVSSNWMHHSMYSHTGCIYFAFLCCGLPNVSSDGLPVRKQSHAVAFVRPFSPVGFHMFSQVACIMACTVTLVALVWHVPTVGF